MASIVTIYDQAGQGTQLAIAGNPKDNLVRNYRATNASDQGRLRKVVWEIASPIGYSRESTGHMRRAIWELNVPIVFSQDPSLGQLACDYVQNLDTRFPRRLISKGARTAVTLTGSDPVGVSNSSKLGQFKVGTIANKLGGPVTTTDAVTNFVEQQGYVLACRGKLGTLVNLSNWTVTGTSIFPETVKGAVLWYKKARIGLGANANMQTMTGVSATGATFVNTRDSLNGDVYAGPLAVGSDRCWFGTRSLTGDLGGSVSYTLNDFQTTAAPFVVGDPGVTLNGIGPHGPFTYVGMLTNLFSFTDQGKPVPLSRALIGHSSANNGLQWADPGWNWNYCITDIGLRAVRDHIDNPVGPGEAMRFFTGHVGRPTALWAERGELFVVYNVSGDLYAYRCTFGPETDNSGQPLFFPWWYKAATTCQAVFSTNFTTNTALMWGEGTNMAYETISRDGRDDLFTARTYDTGGGTWWGTTLDRDPHLLKVLRLARVHTKGMTAGSSWTLAFSFDGGAYTNIQTMTGNDYYTLRPVQNGVPLQSISGRSLKPRLTQVAGGAGASTTSPEVEGVLEIEYDERPTYITEVTLTIDLSQTYNLSRQGVIDRLESIMSNNVNGPVKVRLPDDTGDRWCMVQEVTNRRDLKGDSAEGIDVVLQLWDVA